MKKVLPLICLLPLAMSCNKGGGFRQNQEEVMKPNDYTQGTDVKYVPHQPAEEGPLRPQKDQEQGQ